MVGLGVMVGVIRGKEKGKGKGKLVRDGGIGGDGDSGESMIFLASPSLVNLSVAADGVSTKSKFRFVFHVFLFLSCWFSVLVEGGKIGLLVCLLVYSTH